MSNRTLQEAIEGSIKGQIAIQHNAELGVVKAFNAATAGNGPTADIEMSTLYRRRVEGISETYSPPMLGKVPVLYSRLTFPLAVGDEVLVICIDRGVDTAYENGGTGNEPDGTRQNSLSDAFCIPFAWSKASTQLTHTASTVVLNQGAQTAIHIGKSATNAAARVADDVNASTAMIAWMAAVNTALTAAALLAGHGTVVPPGVGPSHVGNIHTGSSKVKIE